MTWASAISDLPDLERALDAALDDAETALGGARADLAFAFASGHPRRALDRVPSRVRERLPRAVLLGGCAGGVRGGGLEIERRPGVSVALASLPGAELVPWHVDAAGVVAARADPRAMLGPLDGADAVIVVADPFSIDADELVTMLDRVAPAGIKVGGLAAGAELPGPHALFLGEATHEGGAAWIALRGVNVDAIVSQGCRPIGDAMFVTRRRGHLLLELNGRPAGHVVRDLWESLGPEDRALFRTALVLGVGVDPNARVYGPGDFLIRELGGLQRETNGLVVPTELPEYAVVRFHLRDARAAAEDLDASFERWRARGRFAPEGALMVSAVGRGDAQHGAPNRDTDAFHAAFGSRVPVAGFFASGEIAPVAGRTLVHRHASVIATFGSKT